MSKSVYRHLRVLFICVTLVVISLCGCNQGTNYISTDGNQSVLDCYNSSNDTIAQDDEDETNEAGIPLSEVEKQGQQKVIRGYLLWPPVAKKNFEENYTVVFEDRQLFYDAGLQDETIDAIEASYSYYCDTNRVPTSDVELVSVRANKNDCLCRTIINTAGTSLESIIEIGSNFQRVSYIEGDKEMDTFGVLYINMDVAMKERSTNMFRRYIENEDCELYSVKEYNCCYYYFYKDEYGDNKYIRVSKENNEIVSDGMWDENGIIDNNDDEEVTSDE